MHQWEKNAKRKPLEECHLCVSTVEITRPLSVDVCPKCLERIHSKYGKVTLYKDITGRTRKSKLAMRDLCMWCNSPEIWFFTAKVRACEKCINRVGRNVNKFDDYYWEAYGNKPRLNERFVKTVLTDDKNNIIAIKHKGLWEKSS